MLTLQLHSEPYYKLGGQEKVPETATLADLDTVNGAVFHIRLALSSYNVKYASMHNVITKNEELLLIGTRKIYIFCYSQDRSKNSYFGN